MIIVIIIKLYYYVLIIYSLISWCVLYLKAFKRQHKHETLAPSPGDIVMLGLADNNGLWLSFLLVQLESGQEGYTMPSNGA